MMEWATARTFSQLLKRKLLVEAGLPHRVLRMTVVIDEGVRVMLCSWPEQTVATFILDNKRNAVLPWRKQTVQPG